MTTGFSSSDPNADATAGAPRNRPAFLGVMQGRLLPPSGGRIQSFPGAEWAVEFHKAAELGLNSIEWIFEEPVDSNPLWTPRGRAELQRVMDATGVRVHFICADIFMESPWVRMSPGTSAKNRGILDRLIHAAAELGVDGIEIPCVDASEIRSVEEEEELIRGLDACWNAAAENRILIGLETSLGPARFRGLLERIPSPWVRANYDTGNSASLGYDAREEIQAYGRWIANVHIKDRVLGGSTVPLGKGNAKFDCVFSELARAGYAGGYILQAARNGDEMAAVRGYLQQLKSWLSLD